MLYRILLPIVLLISTLALGQTKPTFSINTGVAVPLGNFGANDESAKNGFAKLGPQVNLGINWPLNKKFGIELMAHGQLNPLDASSIANVFNRRSFYTPIVVGKSQSQVYIIGIPGSPPNWKFEKANWSMAGLLAGGTVTLPLNDKLTFNGKAMIGAMYVSKPEIEGRSQSGIETIQFIQDQKGGIGFSYNASASLRWRINDRISLNAGVNYFAVPEVSFKDVQTVATISTSGPSGGGVNQNSQSPTFKQSISTLNFNIGITIRL